MKNFTRLFLYIFTLISIASCQDEIIDLSQNNTISEANPKDEAFKSENFGSPISGNFIGTIKNKEGNLLDGVQIDIGGVVTTTDRNGIFVLNNAPVFENFAYIKAKKQGYIDGSRVVIPKESGSNYIQIVLLKKEVTATISSGEPSEVNQSGVKVSFTGGFIREDGSDYNGNVEVVLNYIRPQSLSTFREMPGSLFAQTTNNDARALETYGMVSVNLFSPLGEVLNINENNPATIEFPVDFSQNDIAPETINLWYFDEVQGYWKEDGQAFRNGNKYIANVTHFTWWNCDIPFDAVEFCFSLSPNEDDNISPYQVDITRDLNNQTIFSGIVYSNNGLECGLIPVDESISISVSAIPSSCSNLIVYEETLTGFSTDSNFDIAFQSISTTSVTGTATNCEGNPITNGYIFVDDNIVFNIMDGTFNIGLQHCGEQVNEIQIFDFDTAQWTISNNISVNGNQINLGNLSTCENSGGIYNGSIFLRTQEEVENFGLFNYEEVSKNIYIGNSAGFPSTDITNLSALSSLRSIGGSLIINNNDLLTTLEGFSGLISISETLGVSNNNLLTSLDGLNTLQTIGLSLNVNDNPSLVSLEGMENISELPNLHLNSNESLSSLSGLENINSINNLNIKNNNSLISLQEFTSLAFSRSIFIRDNANLNSLQGLNDISSIIVSLEINNNDSLTDLSQLSNYDIIEFLVISNNDLLASLHGLENLRNNSYLRIGLNFLNNAETIGPNPSLEDFCALEGLFISGDFVGPEEAASTSDPYDGVFIENNAFNPTIQDIIDGNCSQ